MRNTVDNQPEYITVEPIPAKAQALLRNRTTARLIEDFIATKGTPDPHIYTVRGWIMSELRLRNPEAYTAWLDQDDPTEESLREFYK